jgi:hypothetical protein
MPGVFCRHEHWSASFCLRYAAAAASLDDERFALR